jgi:CRP-like cAMP-binding protein
LKDQAKYFIELYSNYIKGDVQMRTYNRNEFLCAIGDVEHNLFLVKGGAVRAYCINESEELTIRFGYTGSVINSIRSFIDEKPSELCIQALRKTEVMVLPRASYMDFIYSSEETLKMHIEVMHQLVVSMIDREMDLLTNSPKERYNRVIQRSPQLFQHIPLKYIASYLRMTPETLSRLRKS